MLKKFNHRYYIKFIVLICIVVVFNILILPKISHATENIITLLKVDDRTYSNPNKDITLSPVNASTDSITINPTISDGASYTINGGNSTKVPLKIGNNIIKIAVTGGETYIVRITRLEDDSVIESKQKDNIEDRGQIDEKQLLLSSINVKNFELTPEFSENIYSYTVDMTKNDVNKLDIDAIPNLSDATVEIIGNEDLVEGENIITILVNSADGSESVVYQIIVNKNDSSSEIVSDSILDNIGILSNLTPFQRNLLLGFAGFVFLIAIIVIILLIRKAKKNKSEKTLYDGINEEEKVLDNVEQSLEENEIKDIICFERELKNTEDEVASLKEETFKTDKPINKTSLDDEKAALMDEFFSYNKSLEEENKINKEHKKKHKGKGKHF